MKMKNFIKYLIVAFLFSQKGYPPISEAKASSGPDRCFISKCLCRVVPSPPTLTVGSKKISRTYSIYFSENSYEISDYYKLGLIDFMSKLGKGSYELSIIGYTDGCGSPQHNSVLSNMRAKQAKEISRRYTSRISIIAAGEKTGKHSDVAKRVDVIAHSKDRLTTAIEKIPSDYYLIDASGSMWSSFEQWNNIVSASIKPGGKVYLSITNNCSNGQFMRRVKPYGGTEIWWSYWNIIDKMEEGQSLLIISDFQSRVPLSSRERVLFNNKVRDKKIIVRSISL